MAKSIDILISDGAATRIGRAVLRSLRKRGLECEAIDDRPVSRDEPGYLRLLKATLEEIHPKVLIPIFKAEVIARNLSLLPEDIAVPISDAETLRLLDDKCRASALCTTLGIPQPQLYSDEEALHTHGRPVVFKRATGLGGDSVYFPKDGKALGNLIRSSGDRPHLIMDRIDGYDVSVDAIRWDGYFRAAAYRTMVPESKGTSLIRIGVDMPELVSYTRTILDATDYRGACGMDFRIERKSGKAYFLECNPRFSGGIRSSLAAGFDMPCILWQLCMGLQIDESRTRKGVLSVEWKEIPIISRIFAVFNTLE